MCIRVCGDVCGGVPWVRMEMYRDGCGNVCGGVG